MSEVGVADFVSERKHVENYLDFEKLAYLVHPALSTGVYGENYQR